MLDAAFAPVGLLAPSLNTGLAASQHLFQEIRLFHFALKPARILKPPTGHPDQDVVLISFDSLPDLG